MSKSAQSHQAAQARGIRRFVPTSIKPIVVKLTRKLSVTYWPGRRRTVSATLLALLAGFVHSLAAASPAGERVVSGSAVVSRPNASTTLVTQGSQNAIINWQSFSIGAGEGVRFVQPSASAVALNRVVGNDPSRIFGSLSSNGKVFLVNTAGVYFAPGASVDVGGLVASSMNISDRNFMAGNYKFEGGAGAGAVDNQGMLRGAFVVLAAPQVSNSGSIVTTGGSAALAAGGRVSLDIAGDKLVSLNVDAATANAAVVNSGSISADGGKVFMSAHSANAVLDTVINTSGVVRANSIGMRDGQIVIDGGSAGTVAVNGTLAASGVEAGAHGGSVAVLGDRVSLQAGASVDVSGDAGGGSARIGGDFHGAGALKTASMTQVDKGAAINADAVTTGNGGTVAVWSDQHTDFAGSISAKGGAQRGDGGFVETSGKRTLAFSGAVTTKAAKGASGTLLLDPTDITIDGNSTSIGNTTTGSDTTFAESGTANTSVLNVGVLTTALNNGNVIVATASNGGASGNITVGAPITNTTAHSLTLIADHNINSVGSAITTSGGAVNLYADGAITTGAISTGGGNVTIAGNQQSMPNSFSGGGITSGNGNVVVQAGSVSTGAINSGTGTIAVTGNGAININGPLSSTNATDLAIVIQAGAQMSAGSSSGSGDISISGGGAITVSGSGRATLYTGSLAGSTGVAAAIGTVVGDSHFRYNSDPITKNYSLNLSNGVYAVYREQPKVTFTGSSDSMTYGDAIPALSAPPIGLVNGDTSPQAFTGTLSVTPGGSTSTSGLLTAGAHPVTPAGLADQLGYHVDYVTGTLTVATKALTMSGLSAPASKVYDGSTTAVVSGGPALATSEAIHTGSVGDGKRYTGDDVSFSGTASGTYNNKNVVGASSVTFGGLTLAGDDAGNYSLTMQPAVGATITPAVLSATMTVPDKVYDGNATATPVLVVTSGLVGTETVTASGAASFNSKDVTAANQVTLNTTALADGANGGMASNYSLAAGATAAAHITPKALTATVAAPDKVYDGSTTAAPTLTVTGGLVGTETVAASGTAHFDSKDVVTAGTVTVDAATLADGANGGLAGNYSLAGGQTTSAHITPKALTATVAAPDKVYDGSTTAAPTLTVTGGLVGTETVVASGTAHFDSKDVVTAGTVTVDAATLADGANGGLAGNYSLAGGQTTSAHITPKALTATVAAPDKVYDGSTTAAPTLTVTGGLVGTETVAASGTASFNSKDVVNAGTVTVDATTLADGANGGLAGNYSLAAGQTTAAHITPKALTATVAAPDKVYDGSTTAAPTLTVTGGLVGTETVSASGTAHFDSKDVVTAGTVTVDATTLADGANGGLAGNYSLAAGQMTTAHITPKALTATVAAPDKVYDGGTAAAPTLTVTGGLVGTETVAASGTAHFDSKDVVTAGTVTVDATTLANGTNGGLASNYSLAAGQTTAAHITPKALTATVAAPDKVYDGGTTAAPTLTVTGGLVGTETVAASGTAHFDSKDVVAAGTVTVDATTLADGANGGLASNYTLAAGQTTTAHVTPKALTATVAAPDKVYDGSTTAAPTLTVTGGLVGTETVAASGTAHFDSKDVVTAGIVTVASTTLADGANGGLASNYSLVAGQTTTAHVTPKALVASASSADKVYDGTADAPAWMNITGGLVGTETLTATATGSYNSKNVADATQVTINDITLHDGANGGLADNYTLAIGAPVAAHITPKALSMSGLTATTSKVYDGTLDAAVAGAASLAAPEAVGSGNATDGKSYSGDAVSIVGTATGTYNSKDVASASSIAFGGLSLSGADQANYSLTIQAPVAGVVTQRALSATAAAPDKVYDGVTTAAPTLTIASGLVGAETLGVSATGTFNSKDVSTAHHVTVDSTLLADGANGGLASNYSLAAGQTAGAHITPKALTASVAAPDKVYDGGVAATPTLTINSGLVGTETVGVSGTASFNSKDVASANLVTVDSTTLADGANGGLASNYSLAAGQTVAAHVTPKALTANASAPDRAYDGTLNAAPSLMIASGLVGAETVVANATGTFNSKDVLDANLVTVGAVSLSNGANGGIASNYSLAAGQTATAHITPKALTAVASAPNKVYDANVTAAPTLTVSAGLVGAEIVTAIAVGTFNTKDVASADHVTVNSLTLQDGGNGGLASNYSLATGQTAVAHVTPKALTASVTAPGKVYDGSRTAAPTLTVTGGLVGAETVAASGAATFNTKDVLTANLVTVNSTALANGANGGLASNYSLAAGQTTTAQITPKALAATASAPDKVYDANVTAAPTLAITAAGLVGTETVTATGTGTFNSKDVVSANQVTVNNVVLANGANGGLASNYSLTAGQTATAHVTPKALTASVTAPDKVYDGLATAAPALTITGGLVGTETVNATGAATFNTKDVPTANLVTVNTTTLSNGANGGLASNYSLASGQTVTAHISRKSVSMSGLSIPASKVYNANTVAVISGTPSLQAAEAAGAGTTTDLKPYAGDSIAISGTPVGTYNSKDVASAVFVSFSGMTLTGAQAANYLLSPMPVRGATITPAHIASVSSINSANKVYDGNTTAAINAGGAVFNGMMAGDGLSIAGGTANFSDRNVGAGKTVSITGFSLAGTNAPNYILDNNNALALANITRLPSVTYIGASGGDWATASNWQGGALPDGANVAQVVIPAGKSVSFTNSVIPLNGSVQLDNIDGAGSLNVGSGALNVAHALNIGGYGQSGGTVGAESLAASSGFSQTGGTLAVTGALGIQQAAGTVNLGDLTAATMAIGGGAGVRQVDGSAVAVRDGITLATGAGDVILGNANNDFNKVAIGSANNVTLKTKADGLAFGGATIGGDLVASTPGAVTQLGAMAVQGATTLDAGTTLHLDDAANSLHGKVKLTTHGDTSLAATGGVAIGGDIGGALALTTTGAQTQAGDALHVTGATRVNAGSADIVLTNTDNDFGAALSASGRNIAVADKSALVFGATTASGTLDATAGGAVTQSGKLAVGGAGSIVAAGQAVTLADTANSFGGTLRLGAASATVNAAAPLGVTSEVAGALTLAAPQLTVNAANALNLHVATGGNATVNADKALSIDGNVNGALVAKAGGALTQGAAALTVGGASDIQAAGQSVVLANAGNDFGGDIKLAAASAQLADKNALSFTSAAVTGNLQASAKGDVAQKGAINVGGTTSIDTTGAVTLANANNDFVGAVSASGSNVALRDANLLTVGKITAPQVDLTAGYGLQMAGSGIIDSPKVSLALTQFTSNGSIGTATLPFKVKDNANVTLGALTPAVPAFFGGSGVQVSVTNGVALREYSRELVALYLGNSKPYNRVLDDFVSQNIVSLSKILRDAQKKADSSTDLIDNGMPIDLTERAAYPHAGSLKLKEPCKDRKDCK